AQGRPRERYAPRHGPRPRPRAGSAPLVGHPPRGGARAPAPAGRERQAVSARRGDALAVSLALVAVVAGCSADRGAIVQPTGSSARAADDTLAMGDALDQACQDAAAKLSVRGDLVVAPATEGAWTLMAASDLAAALRARGSRVRLVDRDV